MKLSQLMEPLLLKNIEGDDHVEINNIEIDSRKVKQGDLFICLVGHLTDGHRFAADAVNKGAVAILLEEDIDLPHPITKVKVPDTRKAMAMLSDFFYGRPSQQLKLIGVTGTNGKTTITHLIEKIINDHGKKTGLIGTIHMKIGEYTEKTINTTPEAIDLQRYFRKMLDEEAEYAVLEVSSHALEMGRVRGCNFKTAIFSNLTHDHLDYHKTMERYRDSKSLLFSQLGNQYDDNPKYAILNNDDETSRIYSGKTAAQIITYGIDRKSDVQAKEITITPQGTSLIVDTFKGRISIRLKLLGKFNVYNVLAAISACLIEGVPLDQMKKSLEAFEVVSGRLESIHAGQNFFVMVDYAHNPDGLKNVLKTAKEITKGSLFCVVGCEGDKDRKKRPLMAKIAASYSDLAILTSDNTRSEDPQSIINEMLEGLVSDQISSERYISIVDRKEAICYAIKKAEPDDCIIIAGKGHETHLISKDKLIPFEDKEVALHFIKNKLTL